jgi:tetratricopeptide (TPR) repeat protein
MAVISGPKRRYQVDRNNETARDAIAEAWRVMARGDWPSALQHWQRIIERFPDSPSGYAGAGAAFREAGQLDKSEEILLQGSLRFPSSSEIATNHGWIANTRRDWQEAVRRWDSVRARFPESPSGYSGGGAALRELGRFEEAEAVLLAGMERLPNSADIAVTYAGIANIRRDWQEAVRRWERVRLQFPTSPSAYISGAAALKALDRLDDADALLAEGVKQCQARSDVALEYARSAHQREDWAEAVQRWTSVLERFPENTAARTGLEQARLQLQRSRSRPAVQAEDEVAPDLVEMESRRKGALTTTTSRRAAGSVRAVLVDSSLGS